MCSCFPNKLSRNDRCKFDHKDAMKLMNKEPFIGVQLDFMIRFNCNFDK